MTSTLTVMGFRSPQFDQVVDKLAPMLKDLPGRLIAIDGRCGAGKSTLGRFLAWHFNVTLVETDLYLLGDGTLARRAEEMDRIIQARLDRPRPVIVEGVGMLKLLSEVQRKSDFFAYVRNKRLDPKPDKFLLAYEKEYLPWKHADVIVEVEHDG